MEVVKFTIPLLLGLLMMPMVFGLTQTRCIDADTMEINTSQTIGSGGTLEEVNTTETINCQYGCNSVTGQCENRDPGIPMEVYLFFSGTAILFVLISFFKKDVYIFPWFTVIFCLSLAVISFQFSKVYCNPNSLTQDCYVQRYQSIPLAIFWMGLGAIMVIYAILKTMEAQAESLIETEGMPREGV